MVVMILLAISAQFCHFLIVLCGLIEKAWCVCVSDPVDEGRTGGLFDMDEKYRRPDSLVSDCELEINITWGSLLFVFLKRTLGEFW